MILVLGSVQVQDNKVLEALQLSLVHVSRSRQEPGCLEHGVSQDAENPRRLVFVERWASLEALRAHFAVPESRAFVKALAAIATEPPAMALYEAGPITASGNAVA